MKNLSNIRIVAIVLALCCPLFAQTSPVAATARMANAFKLCNEGDTITSGPANFVAQVGVVGSNWTPTVTVTSLPLTLSWATNVPPTGWAVDPDPGVVKEVDVQETAAPQTFVVTPAAGTATTVVVPAISAVTPPVVTPPAVKTCPTTTPSPTGTVTVDAAGDVTIYFPACSGILLGATGTAGAIGNAGTYTVIVLNPASPLVNGATQ